MPKVYKVWAFIEMQSDTTMEVSNFFLQTTISRISLQGFPYLALLLSLDVLALLFMFVALVFYKYHKFL